MLLDMKAKPAESTSSGPHTHTVFHMINLAYEALIFFFNAMK